MSDKKEERLMGKTKAERLLFVKRAKALEGASLKSLRKETNKV